MDDVFGHHRRDAGRNVLGVARTGFLATLQGTLAMRAAIRPMFAVLMIRSGRGRRLPT